MTNSSSRSFSLTPQQIETVSKSGRFVSITLMVLGGLGIIASLDDCISSARYLVYRPDRFLESVVNLVLYGTLVFTMIRLMAFTRELEKSQGNNHLNKKLLQFFQSLKLVAVVAICGTSASILLKVVSNYMQPF